MLFSVQRDNLIDRAVMIQELKYVERLTEWKEAVENLKDQYHKKVVSRLLKYFMDDYLLNRRSMEDEIEIVNECIDANIPIPDHQAIVIALKRAKPTLKAKKTGGLESQRSTMHKASEEKLNRKGTKKDIYSISQDKMRESLAGSHQHVDRGSFTESDFDEAGLERMPTGALNLMPR